MRRPFAAIWLLTTAVLCWQVLQGKREFAFDAGFVLIMACTAALMRWLPGPGLTQQESDKTRRRQFVLAALVCMLLLLLVRDIVGPPLLFGLPVAALGILFVLRPRFTGQQAGYAIFLAVAAAIAALGMTWAKFSVPAWSALQLALVATCLPAGWAMLDVSELAQAGLGRTLLVSEGWRAALLGALQGAMLGTPWALFTVVMGGANNDVAVRSWWQPFVAIQPGIAEEAWGRVFLIPLLYLLLRRFAAARTALTGAVLIIGYWFAYLHTPGGFAIGSLISTLIIGTVYSLPVTYIWLRRGLEPAMGFHFWQDFVRFGVAYLINSGIWT